MASEVYEFVIARLQDDLAENGGKPNLTMHDIGERQFIAKFREEEGDLLRLGMMAAEWAFHPDYQNWPATDWTEHRNVPANHPDGVL